jgi:hypothetical protein
MDTHGRRGCPNDQSDLARLVAPVVVQHEDCPLLRWKLREGIEKLNRLSSLCRSCDLVCSGSLLTRLQLTCRDTERCDPDPSFWCAQGVAASYCLCECLRKGVIGDLPITRVGDESAPELCCMLAVDLLKPPGVDRFHGRILLHYWERGHSRPKGVVRPMRKGVSPLVPARVSYGAYLLPGGVAREPSCSTAVMNIVIGVAPTSTFSLETELRLIKPALLYGDRVTLCSPATSLVAMASAIGHLSDDEKIDFLAQVVSEVSPEQAEDTLKVLSAFRELRRKRRRSREEILLVERVRRQLRVAWEMMRERMDHMVATSGANELAPAVEQGLLEVDVLLSSEEDFSLEQMLQEFLD